MKKTINFNQLTNQELVELEQLVDHSLFECRNCGNQETTIKCSFAKKLEELEKSRQIICQQEIKRTRSCKNLHLENECLEYSGQYCWNHCGLAKSNQVCLTHWKKLKGNK